MTVTYHTDQILTIEGYWSRDQCKAFIEQFEQMGFEEALVNTESGPRRVEHIRNNQRIIIDDKSLASEMWKELKSSVPNQIGNSTAIGLNERFRVYKYITGQEFKKHRDQSFIRANGEASYYTLMIYLNEGFEGGETTFPDVTIKPKTGDCLVFLHDLEHEGTKLVSGTKYVLRTDIMFRLNEE